MRDRLVGAELRPKSNYDKNVHGISERHIYTYNKTVKSMCFPSQQICKLFPQFDSA